MAPPLSRSQEALMRFVAGIVPAHADRELRALAAHPKMTDSILWEIASWFRPEEVDRRHTYVLREFVGATDWISARWIVQHIPELGDAVDAMEDRLAREYGSGPHRRQQTTCTQLVTRN